MFQKLKNFLFIGLISTATDKTNQLHGGLKKVKIEENNSNKLQRSQNNILNEQSEGSLT